MKAFATRSSLIRAIASALLLAICYARSAHAERQWVDPIYGVSVTSGVPYASKPVAGVSSGNRTLRLDVYRPTGPDVPEQLPLVVLMGGGYFMTSSSQDENMVAYGNAFASRGYVAVSINYRTLIFEPPGPGELIAVQPERVPDWLLPELDSLGYTLEEYIRTITAAVDDQASALNYMVANAAAYDINPDWIAVGGFSAGAVSSLMLGAGAIDGVHVNAEIKAVISLQGGMFGTESFIDPGDPAVFIQHGTNDDTVPYSEVAHLTDALDGAGIPYMTRITGGGHSGAAAYSVIAANPDPFYQFIADQLLVPEPSTWVLLAIAGVGLPVFTRFRRTGR